MNNSKIIAETVNELKENILDRIKKEIRANPLEERWDDGFVTAMGIAYKIVEEEFDYQ